MVSPPLDVFTSSLRALPRCPKCELGSRIAPVLCDSPLHDVRDATPTRRLVSLSCPFVAPAVGSKRVDRPKGALVNSDGESKRRLPSSPVVLNSSAKRRTTSRASQKGLKTPVATVFEGACRGSRCIGA